MVVRAEEPEKGGPAPTGIQMDRCGVEMASLPLAAARMAKAWKVARDSAAEPGREEQAVADADARGMISDVNEVGTAIMPSGGKSVRVTCLDIDFNSERATHAPIM